MRCRGRAWWTAESQPAAGPGPGTRELWRFDVRDALTLTPVVPFAVDASPGCPPEALQALEAHWRAGRIGDADHERLQVLARAQDAALERYRARVRAAPAGAPRVELTDETGLVTTETVPAVRAAGPGIAKGGLRLARRASR